MVEVELEHVGRFEKVGKLSAIAVHDEDLMQGKYDGIVAVPFMLLFSSFFILFKNCSCFYYFVVYNVL